MSAAARPSLKLLCHNVNGLRGGPKRAKLFGRLLAGRWDVVLLQETHHASSAEGLAWAERGGGLGLPWRGPSFWHHGTTVSRGVAVLFRDGLEVEDVCLGGVDGDGRILRVDFTLARVHFALFCVYAPASGGAARAEFFRGPLRSALAAARGRTLLLGGDFNCAGSPLDRRGGGPAHAGAGALGGFAALSEVQGEHGLVDVWRDMHPTGRRFTYVGTAPGAAGVRLDRWLLSSAAVPWAVSTGFELGLPGDHEGVTLHLAPASSPLRGPGRWRLPLGLLHDDAFVAAAKRRVAAVLGQPVAAGGAFATRGERWDAVKAAVRDEATLWAWELAHERRAGERLVRAAADVAHAAFSASPGTETERRWTAASADLQAFEDGRAATAALHAGVRWQDYGEQPSFWFHHLTRRRQQAATIHELAAPLAQPSAAGSGMASPPEVRAVQLCTAAGCRQAGEILRSFYAPDSPHGLFAVHQTSAQHQAIMLDALAARLSEENVQRCEGQPGASAISAAELCAALDSMTNGRSCGSDGLPYEFYVAFWSVLGDELAAVASEAWADGGARLPASMQQGLIVPLFKGKGSRADPAMYRPITLLNCDYKLLAKALVLRFAEPLASAVDATQTAFLPGRWIGDNILAHLEILEYAHRHDEPGCIVMLDFAKAYDRVDRAWLGLCAQRLGMGPGALRWLELMLAGTSAQVVYNGFRTPSFQVPVGLWQGSPLSPLLWVVAAQPLAARMRQLVVRGTVSAIMLPSGRIAAPPSHQHADDTCLHVRSIADARVALAEAVQPFCAASGSQLQPDKSVMLLLGAAGGTFTGTDPVTGVQVLPRGEAIRHLGIQLSHDPVIGRRIMYDGLVTRVRSAVAHWSTVSLCYLGRVYVAKQCLASMLYYHAMYVTPPSAVMRDLQDILACFVARGRLPAADAAATSLRPSRAVSALPWAMGGVRLADIASMVKALQAKVVARALEPERRAWKAFFVHWLHRPARWYDERPGPSSASAPEPRSLDLFGCGLHVLFTRLPLKGAFRISARVLGYVRAWRALHPHRLTAPAAMARDDVLCEPLFYSRQVRGADGQHFGGAPWKAAAAAGMRTVGDLARPDIMGAARAAVGGARVDALLAAVPAPWRAQLAAGDLHGPAWVQNPAGTEVWHRDGNTWVHHAVSESGAIHRLPSPPLSAAPAARQRARVVSWDSRRLWARTAKDRLAAGPGGLQFYLVEQQVGGDVVPAIWGWGKTVSTELVVANAADRLRVLQRDGVPGEAVCPAIWSGPRGLSALDAAQTAATRRLHSGTVPGRRLRTTDFDVPPPPWFAPSPPRVPPATRAQRRHDGPPMRRARPPLPSDEIDRAAPPSDAARPPWQGVYACLHDSSLDRTHRGTAWKLLHGALFARGYRAQWAVHSPPEPLPPPPASQVPLGFCTRPGCADVVETFSHLFLECPLSARVWLWVQGFWTAITQQAPPPIDSQVLLVGHRAAWDPGSAALWQLWTRIRIATIHFLWTAASQRDRHGTPTNAPSVAARVVYFLISAIRSDFVRVVSDIRRIGSDCASWFRGRPCAIAREEFEEMWGCGGVLCRVDEVQGPPLVLRVLLSCSHPVPLPR